MTSPDRPVNVARSVGSGGVADLPIEAWTELAPLLRRAVALDPAALARIRIGPTTVTSLVRLPFGVLVGRTIPLVDGHPAAGDVTISATEVLQWIDGQAAATPPTRDGDWRGGVPPAGGWARIDVVPDDVVRGLVRRGALALKEAAAREGVPGAQPRAAVADALLDSVVLTVTDQRQHRVDVTLRLLSAITRMGFLARDSELAVDVAGRWTRLAARYGSGYAERAGLSLTMRG
jgi:hypothetical protein